MGFAIENGELNKYTEDGVTEVMIPKGVTRISVGAFKGCKGLKSVTIPNSVTSIGWGAFKGCKGLKSVTIPDGVTEIGWDTFKGCTGLTSVMIPDGVTSVGWGAFKDCASLTSVKLPYGVRKIGWSAFSGCTGLTSVTIPDSVTKIGWGAFGDCKSLKAVVIPKRVKKIGWRAFEGCKNLKSVTIPDSVTEIGKDAFSGTPWLAQQKDEFVIVGNHVLIHYNGDISEVHIPDSVVSFDMDMTDDWETVIRHGVTYARDPKGEVSVKDMLSMVQEKYYDVEMRPSVKYGILWQVFCNDPNEAKLFSYIRKNFTSMFRFAIGTGNVKAVKIVCRQGKLLTARNIDQFLAYAAERKQTNIQLLLMNYKNEKIGFDKKKMKL